MQRFARRLDRTSSVPWLLLGLAIVPALPGCGREAPQAKVLRLLSFRQEGQSGVFLNETLVLHFDAEIDLSSVTRTSVSIVREDGTPARGRLDVQGAKVLFVPEAPKNRDLMDGGLTPASDYRVVVRGLPNPDGVRGREGEPLSRTQVLGFRTTGAVEGDGPRFEDPSPDRSEPLRFETQELGPFDPIRLVCDEPIDPSTLYAEDFDLRRYWKGHDKKQEGDLDPIPLRADLRSNGEGGARIELRPLDEEGRLRALPIDRLHLWLPPASSRLRDFGGHPVLTAWLREPQLGYLDVREPEQGPRVGSYLEEFLDERRRSPARIEGVAGTAHWAEGTVGIRFPAAAGNGSDGATTLSGEEARSEIRATSLDVPKEEVVRLTGDGLVVLRAQGRITIDGSLRRDVEGKLREAEALGISEYSDWHRWADAREEWMVEGMSFDEGETLTHWLERATELDAPWTVIVAGGEILVRGDIWFDGPLLLVAGGWIRVNGEIRDRPRQFWTIDHPLSSRTTASTRLAPLTLDEPVFNPLSAPLTWSVMTAPYRPQGGVDHWRPARVFSDAGGGSIRVSYVGERDLPGSVEVVGPVDSPVLLEDCEAIKLRIDLTVGPRPNFPLWEPPVLDAVELAWGQPELER